MNARIGGSTILTLWSVMFCLALSPAVGEARGPLEESGIRALVDAAPDEVERPDAEAVILFDGTYITYEDGRASLRRQRLVKIYTEYAIDEVGDPRLAYDRSRQELEIHVSRTYLLDGSTMDTPDNGYNEVTPFGLDRSVAHLDLREMVVSHVGIERGVSILLDWTVRDKAPTGIPFNRAFLVFDEFPALEKEVVARGDLYGETVNPPASGFTVGGPERKAGAMVWHVRDIPRRPHLADERPGDQMPWIAVSAAPSWESLLGLLAGRAAMAAASTHHVEQVLKDLEEDAPFIGEREFLERIAEAIGEGTQLVRYRPWIFTPAPRNADALVITSTTTPLERSVLVMSACEVRGLKAELVIPAVWQTLPDRVPVLEALADPLVRVIGSGGYLYVDPVDGQVTGLAPIGGGMPYFIGEGEWIEEGLMKVTLERAPVRANDIRLSVFWDLNTGEAEVDGHIQGPVVIGLDWEGPGQLLEAWAAGWTDSAEAGEVRVLESSPEAVVFALSVDAPLPAPDDRGRLLLELPVPPMDMDGLLPNGLNLVRSATDGVLFPPAPASAGMVWKIRMPEGYTLLPGLDRETVLQGGSLSIKRTQDADLVELGYHFNWDGRPVEPAGYGDYRALLLDATDRRLTTLVLTEEEEED